MAFTHPIRHSRTHVAAAIDKSPTAQDFTDITEVAEDEGEVTPTATPTRESSSQSGGDVERLYQKGISFAQSQLAGEQECAPTHLLLCKLTSFPDHLLAFIIDIGTRLAAIGQPYFESN